MFNISNLQKLLINVRNLLIGQLIMKDDFIAELSGYRKLRRNLRFGGILEVPMLEIGNSFETRSKNLF